MAGNIANGKATIRETRRAPRWWRTPAWVGAAAIYVVTITIAAFLMALLAACDSQPPPKPTPTSTPSRAPSTNPAAQAPKVDTPLDADSFVSAPCTSLATAQQQEFGLNGGEPTDYPVEGPGCFYGTPASSAAVAVVFASNKTTGLSYRYGEHASGFWDYWEPTEVDGYPALAYETSEPGSCNFAIGVTDSLFFWVTADETDGDNYRCTTARAIASAVLSTIKADQ